MGGTLVISEHNWLEVKGSTEQVPMPFKHDIFLKECHVAGTMHVDDILCKTKGLAVGSPLVLKRDVHNEYDELAIGVETEAGDRIGWVPRKYNDIPARLMDAGKLLTAKVVYKEVEDHWLDIRMEIYMKDI